MFLNISTYRFCALEQLDVLQEQLLLQAQECDLKGTILIAPEGINMFLAGSESCIRTFLVKLNAYPALAHLVTKDSWSEHQPFKKMRVKIKDEIIRMQHPLLKPHLQRAPSLSPQMLHKWLTRGADDQGNPIILLDTRNAFEHAYGSFNEAIHLDIEKFSDFPKALAANLGQLQNKTIVSFCTGGIRCEKANLFMQEIGLKNTWQLDGGILHYFAEVGKDFYQGTCFVFDERIALDTELTELAEPPLKK